MLTIARRATLLGLMAVTLAMGGCGDDDDGTGPSGVAGTYTLRTVNDQALPYTLYEDESYKIEIMASELTINSGGTWRETATFRETELGTPATSTQTVTGTYTRTGNTIVLADADSDTITGTIQGDGALVIAGNGLTARYTK